MYHEVFLAAKNGNVKGIEALQKKNPRLLKERTFEGNSILHVAARAGHFDMVEWILGNVERCRLMSGARNVDGDTPLHEAARGGNAEVVRILLQCNNCPSSKRNQFGESALLLASEHGHLRAVELLLPKTPLYLILWPRNDHQTCLHVAAYAGHLEIVKAILGRPSICNILPLICLIPDAHGSTPLHSAVHGGHLSVVSQIVRTEMSSVCCLNVLSWVCWRKLLDRSLMTKKDNLGWCAVHVAAVKGRWDIVEEFMSTMPDCVEIRSRNLKTPLHLAVQHDQFEVVQNLLFCCRQEEAAKLVSCDRDICGNTALHLAAQNEVDPQLMEHLLSFPGININAVNDKGESALDMAVAALAASDQDKISICSKTVFLLQDGGATRSFIANSTPLHSRHSPQDNGEGSNIMDVDTLVASLIATITFAAIFTAPTGITSDTKHRGEGDANESQEMALKTLFQVFLFSDSLAMFSSLTVVMAWLFRERLQEKLVADRSLLANLSVLSLGISIVCTGLAFLSATILVTIPRDLNKGHEKYKQYRLLSGAEILTAFIVPSLALALLALLWVFQYYFKTTLETRAVLKRQLKQVMVYVMPPFSVVLLIIMLYGHGVL